jgi:hypothetical protein
MDTSSLNEQQKRAVLHMDGPVRVIAGAGCITGDTEIRFNRARKGFKTTIKKAFESFNHKNTLKGNSGWSKEFKTYVRSFKSNVIKLHEVEGIVYSGVKEVFRLTLSNGLELKATSDHKIMTPEGWVELGKLSQDHHVMCDNIGFKPSESLEKKTTDSTKNKKQTQKPKRYTGGVGPTSLNLSHAVGVLAYEIHQAMGNNNVSGYNSRLISVEERVRLVDELHAARRSLDVFAAETSDASVDADVDESKTYSDPSQNRLESLEHDRERRAFANVLNAGPIATRDATVLFTLARRVLENKPYSNTDDAVRAAATSFRETKNSGNKKNEEPSVKAVINAVRESCGISMTTRETERVLRALGEAMDE